MAQSRKIIRLVLVVFGSLVGLFLLAAVVLPMIYEDDIHASLKTEINRNLQAKVDYSEVNLSLISNFPYFGIGLHDLEVVGEGVFHADTLAQVKELQLAVSVWSLFGDDGIAIKKVILEQPRVHAIVLPDGRANWDIALPDTAKPDTAEPEKPLNLQLSEYALRNAEITYDDRMEDIYATLQGVSHEGSGNFVDEVVKLETKTVIEDLYVRMEEVAYLNHVTLQADAGLTMDLPEEKYSFRKNRIQVNGLPLAFDGFVDLNGEAMDLDLSFAAEEASVKSLYSLIPGTYTEDFGDIKSKGDLSVQGNVKGTYLDSVYPTFDVKVKAENGFIQYPDLPKPVSDLFVDLHVYNETADLNTMVINLKQLKAKLGSNPIDARFRLAGLEAMKFDTRIQAKVDLAEVMQIFPVEGYVLKGNLDADLKAQGTLDTNQLPVMDGHVGLKYGYVKSEEYNVALENMTVDASAQNQSGQPEDTKLNVKNFHAELGGEPIDMSLLVKGIEDPFYDLNLKGRLDLAKLLQIYPMEKTEMSGILAADIQSKGKLSALENEAYDKLPTSGEMTVNGLTYKDPDLPMGLAIPTAKMRFNPKSIILEEYQSTIGRSDMQLTGHLDNYMGYVLRGDPISGNLSMTSKLLDANQFMGEEEEEAETEEPLEAVEVPPNIDFVFDASIDKILYDELSLTDFTGGIKVSNGRLSLMDSRFNTLGGQFGMSGFYDTKETKNQPKINFDFALKDLSIQQTAENIELIRAYAPAAKYANGDFSSDFTLDGQLNHHMEPMMNTFNGQGSVTTQNVVLKGFPVLERIAAKTKMNNLREMTIEDMTFQAEIKDGRLHVEPFDIQSGKLNMTVEGSNGFEGGIDYTVTMDAPKGQLGKQVTQNLSNLLGNKLDAPDNIRFAIGVGGSVDNPKITSVKPVGGGGESAGDAAKQAAKDKAKETIEDKTGVDVPDDREEARRKARERAREEAKKRRKEAEEKARREAEKRREKAEEKAKDKVEEEKEKAKDKAKDKVKDELPWD